MNIPQERRNLLRLSIKHQKIGSIDLNGNIPFNTRQHLGNAHLNGLGKTVGDPRYRIKNLTNALNEFILAAYPPHFLGLKFEKRIGLIKTHGVQTDFIGTHAGRNSGDLRDVLEYGLLNLAINTNGLLQIDGRQLFYLNN